MEKHLNSEVADRPARYPLQKRLWIAAITAMLLMPVQFVVFDCNKLVQLSVVTGALVFGGLAFCIVSLMSRAWKEAAIALVVAVLSSPVMLFSHICP